MSKVLSVLNDRPIIFYGKLIDQYGAPVSGAEVKGSVLRSVQWGQQTKEINYTTTDGDGLFSFSNLRGMNLGIWFKKDGYEFTSNKTAFTYSDMYPEKERHKPDPNAPVIFTIWKLQGAQQLVRIGSGGYISTDGTPASFDFITKQRVAEGGDVTMTFTRVPAKVEGETTFDWKLKISIANGGIVANNDQYPNQAPESGYEPDLIIDMPIGAKPWLSQIRRGYYVKFRGGRCYGRVTLDIDARFPQSIIPCTLGGYANTSGSRNLEMALLHR